MHAQTPATCTAVYFKWDQGVSGIFSYPTNQGVQIIEVLLYKVYRYQLVNVRLLVIIDVHVHTDVPKACKCALILRALVNFPMYFFLGLQPMSCGNDVGGNVPLQLAHCVWQCL